MRAGGERLPATGVISRPYFLCNGCPGTCVRFSCDRQFLTSFPRSFSVPGDVYTCMCVCVCACACVYPVFLVCGFPRFSPPLYRLQVSVQICDFWSVSPSLQTVAYELAHRVFTRTAHVAQALSSTIATPTVSGAVGASEAKAIPEGTVTVAHVATVLATMGHSCPSVSGATVTGTVAPQGTGATVAVPRPAIDAALLRRHHYLAVTDLYAPEPKAVPEAKDVLPRLQHG